MFEFIKAVSDTVFEMINAVHYDKPLIFIRSSYVLGEAVELCQFFPIDQAV